MKEQMEIAKLQAEFNHMEELAYETFCDLEVAIYALKQIRDGETTTNEMIGVATWALNIIDNIVGEPYTLNN